MRIPRMREWRNLAARRRRAGGAVAGGLLVPCLVVLLQLATAGPAAATQADMDVLPVVNPNRCLTCHVVVDPVPGDAELNVFGGDFLDNGRLWNPTLAQLDSDLDGCLNGVEIGDANGDGIADGNVDEQAGNPGVPGDCAAGGLTDEKTWSALKAIFDGRR